MALDEPFDDEFLRHVADDVLLPMLRQSPPSARRSVR